jgi:parallel beta-helix repeat protein
VLGVLGGGLAAFAPSIAGATPPAGGTLYVATTGADSGSCRQHANPCLTIGYALTQAPASSSIDVAAGTYAEQVVINQNVTIKGASTSSTIIQPTSLGTADTAVNGGSQPQYAIVDITSGASAANLKNLTIDGSKTQGQFTGCGDDFLGVYYHDASGSMNGVAVENIQLPQPLFGCQQGLGVLVDTDTNDTSAVSMSGVTVTAYDKNGITCDDIGTTCTISQSTVTGIGATSAIAQNGIQVYDATGATLTSDKVSDASYTGGGANNEATGLLIYDVGTFGASQNKLSDNDINAYIGSDGTGPTQSAWTFEDNTVKGATDNVSGGESLYGDGIQIDSTTNSLTVSGNTVTGSAENGISLLGVSNATVSGNTSSTNGVNGIYVGGPGPTDGTGSTGNTIENNTMKGNTNDGILADSDSSTNSFSDNTTVRNHLYDLQDLGTSNSWSGNSCTPANDSSPSGLCS